MHSREKQLRLTIVSKAYFPPRVLMLFSVWKDETIEDMPKIPLLARQRGTHGRSNLKFPIILVLSTVVSKA